MSLIQLIKISIILSKLVYMTKPNKAICPDMHRLQSWLIWGQRYNETTPVKGDFRFRNTFSVHNIGWQIQKRQIVDIVAKQSSVFLGKGEKKVLLKHLVNTKICLLKS